MTHMDYLRSAGVVVVLVLVAVEVVPFALADGQTRRSMWQARLIRWRWRRLARMLGLYASDPTQTVVSVIVGERGQLASPPRPRILIPRIRVRADAYGVVVRVKTLPKVGRDEWVKASPHLANAWGCVRVAVTQDEPGRLVVR